MPVVPRPAGPTHELPGAAFTSLATPSRGGAETAVWAVTLAPGHAATPHQVTRPEVFVALRGRARVRLDGATHDLRAGDALVVPADTPFAIEAAGPEDFEALCCLPAGGQAIIDGGEPFAPPWSL